MIKYDEAKKLYRVSYSRRHPVTKQATSLTRTGIKTMEEAKRTYNELIIKMEQKFNRSLFPLWPEIVDRFIEHFRNRGIANNTVYNYKTGLYSHTVPRWEKKQINEITTSDIRELVLDGLGHKSEALRKDILKYIRATFTYAVDMGIIQRDPTPKIKSISLNPLMEGTVNQVVDRIMRSFDWSEPYYRDASRRSLTKALQKLEKDGEGFTLKKVFDELVRLESKENIGLIAKIEAILVSDFGKILNSDGPDALTLSKIRDEKACLYIGLSTQGYGETATAVGKLFLGELLYNSYKTLSKEDSKGLENPISIYFDEFGSLVTPEFIELQNKCRGAGMELTLAVQTASDIDRVNPDLTKQVIENAGNLFILKQRLDSSASLFADAVGTILAKKQTYRIENGEQQKSGSEREVYELIVHPDIIKNLGIGQCVLLRQGPTRVNMINVRNRRWDVLRKDNAAKHSAPSIV
ncbi:TraM recognition domain-containing protein [Peredibacter starrii]|uniref:TraM recognition domain-containing protein n=1 Tax=Peredibacter starrii TaxID=28202 RepID=A0AAX4HSX6_9BACT|nr:TraM recognition domain-containing protein [Peredibacter starrii]WPU66490.1 TraM recognition domain-containing protein [Peredibacter starrii]